MNIKTALTISRDSYGKINVYIEDRASHIRFVELSIDAAEFASALTGLSWQECEAEVRGLEYVGMESVTEKRQARYYLRGSVSRADAEAWLVENYQEDGWILDPYLGSQGSMAWDGGVRLLNYRVKKYVPVEDGEAKT